MHMAWTSSRRDEKLGFIGLRGLRPISTAMLDVRETRVREGPVEVVTLQTVTNTPRRRTLSESYEHALTPVGELPPVRRRRLKAESSARGRAILRLQPGKHSQHLQECKRKRKCATAPEARHTSVSACQRMDPDRQRLELERQVRIDSAPDGSCL